MSLINAIKKIAQFKLNKISAWDENPYGDYSLSDDIDMQFEGAAMAPDEIEYFDRSDIPEQYDMGKYDDEDYDTIIGIENDEPYSESPKTGRKSYDVLPDINLPLTEEEEIVFEEQTTDAATELEDLMREMVEELDESNE